MDRGMLDDTNAVEHLAKGLWIFAKTRISGTPLFPFEYWQTSRRTLPVVGVAQWARHLPVILVLAVGAQVRNPMRSNLCI